MALDFNPMEFFKEELNNQSQSSIRIQAVQRLNLIASALGKERTENELLVYLKDNVLQSEPFCNDDELLFSMAEQYKELAELVNPSAVQKLIEPLEILASQEETVIREEAIKSLISIVEKRKDLVPEHVVPTLHRLSTKSDFFTARVSACSLFPTVYREANNDQKFDLRKAYITICADDTPMVRRAAANKMESFLKECAKEDLLADMMVPYKQLSQEDTQDTIRVACVKSTLVIAKMLTPEENRNHTIQVIKDAGEDRSWRVRLVLAKQFHDLIASFGPELTQQHLMSLFISLLKDHEQEVRKEAVKIIGVCIADPEEGQAPILPEEQLQNHLTNSIVPQFQQLSLDQAQPVRAALAQVMGPVAKKMGRDFTQRHLLPLISDLMKDEFHDVRLNIVDHAGLLCEVLTAEGLVSSLLHTIQSLIMDNHWRIRKSVVEQVPKLARRFGQDMFVSKLEALFLSSLRDSVHSVRQAAIDNIKHIAHDFGAAWTQEHLLTKIIDQYSQAVGYANRVTTLKVFEQVAGEVEQSAIQQTILPLLQRACKDSVPNVRFVACNNVKELIENKQVSQADWDKTLKPLMLELKDDSDIDVQYQSKLVLEIADTALKK